MNKTHKVIWNANLGQFVVTSELSKSKTKTKAIASAAFGLSSVLISLSPLTPHAQTTAGTGSKATNPDATAIGLNAQASSQGTTAIGNATSATKLFDTAIGSDAKASGGSALAAGYSAIANGTSSVALGYASVAAGSGSVALGISSRANAYGSIALGGNSVASNEMGTAVGSFSNATGASATSLGASTSARGQFSTAIGYRALVDDSASSSTAIGANSNVGATAVNSLAIGSTSSIGSGSIGAIAVGPVSSATGSGSMALGRGALANASGAMAIGSGSDRTLKTMATATDAAAIGSNATANATQATALGFNSVANGTGASAIGRNAIASGEEAFATNNATASGKGATAMGRNSLASGLDTFAMGYAAVANGSNAVAIGGKSLSSNTQALAIGYGANATNINATAIGVNSMANNVNATAIGVNSLATGTHSVSIGTDAAATEIYAVAVGKSANAADVASVAIGYSSKTQSSYATAIGASALAGLNGSTAIGGKAQATGESSVSIGRESIATGVNSVSAGTLARATDRNSVALGSGVVASADTSTALGFQSSASGILSVAIGREANAQGRSAIAFGDMSKAYSQSSMAFGLHASVDNTSSANSIALGSYSSVAADATSSIVIGPSASVSAGSKGAVAIGRASSVQAEGAVALGRNTIASGTTAISIGGSATDSNTIASAENATAIGIVSNASGIRSLAIGTGAKASGVDSISIGTANDVSGSASGAIGDPSVIAANNSYSLGNNNTINAGADNSFAIGNTNTISTDNTFVLGSNVSTTLANSVILGANSATISDTNISGELGTVNTASVNGINYAGFAGETAAGVVSVGNATATRRIQGVSAGLISATSTDAINGSQLYQVGNALGNATKSVADALGGGSVANPDGSVTPPTLNANGQTFNNVAAAIAAVNGTANAGWNLAVGTGTPTNVAPNATLALNAGQNIAITTDATDPNNVKLNISTTPDLSATSLQLGGATGPKLTAKPTATDATGATVPGLDVGGSLITNIKPGVINPTSTDAINGSQLYNTAASVVSSLGGTSTVGPNGTVVAGLDVGGNKFNNVQDALGSLSTTANAGWKLQVNGDTAKAVPTNSTVEFNAGQNIAITRDTTNANNLTIATKPNLNATSLQLGGASGPNLTGATAKDATGATVPSLNVGGSLITNVKPGVINPTSTDAINGSQLYNTAASVVSSLGGTSTVGPNGTVVAGLDVGGNKFNNVQDALGNLSTTANAGWKLQVNGDTAQAVPTNSTVQFANGQNIAITRNANNITIATTANLNATSLQLGGATGPNLTGATAKDATGATVPSLNVGGSVITNVKPGVINATSSDAINGSQLFNTTTSVASSLGGNSKINPDGTVTANLAVGGTNFGNVQDALSALNTTASAGWKLKVNGDTAQAVATNSTVEFVNGQNIAITRDKTNANNITIATNPNLTATSLQLGGTTGPKLTGATAPDATGATVPSLNVGGSLITNVKPGVINPTSTDAINGSQLYNTAASVATSLGGTSTVGPNGTVVAGLDVGGKNFNNVQGALSALNGTANAGWNLTVGGATPSNVAPNGTVNFNGSQNIAITRDATNANNITIATNPNLTATSLQLGGATGPKLTGTTGKDATGATVPSLNVGGSLITNVKPGVINAASTDAINGSQLFNTTTSVASSLGGNSKINPDGTVTANLAVGGTNFGNVQDALSALNTTASAGWKLKVNGDAAQAVATNSTVEFVNGQNIAITRDAANPNNITIATDANLTATSLQLGGTTGPKLTGTTATDASGATVPSLDVGGSLITNIKAGNINATSTDAINGSQLYNTTASVASSLGGNSKVNPDGTVTASLAVGGTNFGNVQDALSALNTTANAGWKLQVNDDTAEAVTTNSTVQFVDGQNIAITRDATNPNNITIATTSDLVANSLRLGDALTGPKLTAGSTANAAGNTVNSIDVGNSVLTGLQDGKVAAGSTDAVTGNQLRNTASSVANSFGGNSVVNPDGTVTANLSVGGNNFGNVQDALSALNSTASAGWNLQVNGDSTTNVAPNSTVSFNAGKNITVTRDSDTSNNLTIATTDDLNINSIQFGDNGPKLTGGTTLNAAGTSVPSLVVGNSVITGVEPGKLNSSSTDAINGSQLYNLGSTVADILGNGTTFDITNGKLISTGPATAAGGSNVATPAAAGNTYTAGNGIVINQNGTNVAISTGGAGTFNTVTASGDGAKIGIADGPSLSGNGIDAAGTRITNVAPGVASTDAANVGQLGAVNKNAIAAAASATAMANLPQVSTPGKSMVAMSYGNNQGQGAMALGVTTRTDDGRFILKASGAYNSNGKANFGFGGGMEF